MIALAMPADRAGSGARATGAGAQIYRPDRPLGDLRDHSGRNWHPDHAPDRPAKPGDWSDKTNAAISKMLEEYKGRKGELLDQFARVYAIRFTHGRTAADRRLSIDSPTGTKLAQANSEINIDLQRVMQVFTGNVQAGILRQGARRTARRGRRTLGALTARRDSGPRLVRGLFLCDAPPDIASPQEYLP